MESHVLEKFPMKNFLSLTKNCALGVKKYARTMKDRRISYFNYSQKKKEHLSKISTLCNEVTQLNSQLEHMKKQVKMLNIGTDMLDEIMEKQASRITSQ
jgi:predicted nuclease with TOPRIM domain